MSDPIKVASKSRTTKKEKHEFIKWYLSEPIHETVKDYSGGKVSQEFQKATGCVLSATFINRNRNNYVIHNAEVVPKYLYDSLQNGNFK